MGTWGEETFDNDAARDYLEMLTMQLVARIKEVAADGSRLEPDEDGESLFMPSVEILALLCERYNAAPPRTVTVQKWREQYLALFDRDLDGPDAAFKAGRRKVIENTFRWLESLAESYHDH
jgi:hypothetical protein